MIQRRTSGRRPLPRRRLAAALRSFAVLAAAISAAALSTTAVPAAAQETLVFGAGNIGGLYFPVSGAVIRVVSDSPSAPRILIEATSGSAENLLRLRNGELDFAIVRSDHQHDRLHGLGDYGLYGPDPTLRSLFSLHGEPLTPIVRRDAGFQRLEELPPDRLNLGPPGTATRAALEALMTSLGWPETAFDEAAAIPLTTQSAALCDGEVDAIAFLSGHPTGTIQNALAACDTVLLAVEGPAADRLLVETEPFAPSVIPGGLYPGAADDLRSLGPVATVVARHDVDAEAVYQIVRAVFTGIDALRAQHPALRQLSPQQMAVDGLTAPLHDGAARYYAEAGLL